MVSFSRLEPPCSGEDKLKWVHDRVTEVKETKRFRFSSTVLNMVDLSSEKRQKRVSCGSLEGGGGSLDYQLTVPTNFTFHQTAVQMYSIKFVNVSKFYLRSNSGRERSGRSFCTREVKTFFGLAMNP